MVLFPLLFHRNQAFMNTRLLAFCVRFHQRFARQCTWTWIIAEYGMTMLKVQGIPVVHESRHSLHKNQD